MKLAILAAFLGSAAVASASKTVAGDVDVDFESHSIVKYVYAPPAVDTDLATLWNALAKEAAFMQQEIALGRTQTECEEDCDNQGFDDPDFNKARCRQNCGQMDNNSRNNNRMDCSDCDDFPHGGNRYERCKESCWNGNRNRVNDCRDADSCGECRKYCGTGNALDRCLDDYRCPGFGRSDRDCEDARTCGECNSWCDNGRDRRDCWDDNWCDAEGKEIKLKGAHQQ